jgi:Protein of unknown function (DUF3551)
MTSASPGLVAASATGKQVQPDRATGGLRWGISTADSARLSSRARVLENQKPVGSVRRLLCQPNRRARTVAAVPPLRRSRALHPPDVIITGFCCLEADIMRTLTVASILLGTVVLGTGAASAAPWCTEYGGSGRGGSNCGFCSFEQCMANAWGNGGFCRRNAFEDPYWTGRTTYRRYRRGD